MRKELVISSPSFFCSGESTASGAEKSDDEDFICSFILKNWDRKTVTALVSLGQAAMTNWVPTKRTQ